MRAFNLFEVVLYTPVEVALEPWLKRAPNNDIRQWLLTVFKNWLTKSQPDLFKLPYLPVNADDKQKKAFSFNDLYDVRISPATEGELEHIMDFFENNPELPRLSRMSVENVIQAAEDWVKQMNAKAKKQPDNPKEVKTLMEFPGGYRMVDLIGKVALEKEGALMGHCVGGGSYWEAVQRGGTKIYSLRDTNNHPHVTIEVDSHDNSTRQIKGVGNQAPVRRYWPMLRAFFQQSGIKVDGDYRNIGLLHIWDGEQYLNLTQDEFKDLILDPKNQEGQRLLQYYNEHGIHRTGNDFDMSMGMFAAMYGTAGLRDGIVRAVFTHTPVEAIQVVEQFGNRLTPEQTTTAFLSLPKNRNLSTLYKRLLIAAKPTDETIKAIMDTLEQMGLDAFQRDRDTERNVWRHNYFYEVEFVTALAEVLPASYKRLMGTTEAIEQELNSPNERNVGPFYAFIGDPEIPEQLIPFVPEMIEVAFSSDPVSAAQHIAKKKIALDKTNGRAALLGFSKHYWSAASRSTEDQKLKDTLQWLYDQVKPDIDTINAVFESVAQQEYRHRGKGFASTFLEIVQHHVDNLPQQSQENALKAIDDDKMIISYLHYQPNPTPQFQHFLYNRKQNDIDIMVYVQNVDPSLFKLVLERLRPKGIDPNKDDYKTVPDKAKRNNPQTATDKYATKQLKFNRPKTPEEREKDITAQRNIAKDRFLSYLAPLIKDAPPKETYIEFQAEPVDPNSQKYKVAQQAFATLGKDKLFEVAVKLIDARSLHQKIAGSDNRWSGNGGDRNAMVANIDKMSDRAIARVINAVGYSQEMFKVLVDADPKRVPGVIRDYMRMNRNNTPYGDLKFAGLDKEKTFDALEAVWADPKLPDGTKDDFTVKVFKRFKPPAKKLMQMLRSADNENAVTYVLKKTKNPSDELLMYVAEKFPDALGNAQNISPKILAHIFKTNMPFARSLMDWNLRGYGPNSRSKWSSHDFHNKIDPTSESFTKYQEAAKAAGKEDEFNRYVQQAQLDDRVRNNEFETITGKSEHGYDLRDLNYDEVIKHINDFSNSTIIKLAHEAKDEQKFIRLCFHHFNAKKLANLVHMGLFKQQHSSAYVWVKRNPNDYYGGGTPIDFLKTLDTKKVEDMAEMFLGAKNANKDFVRDLFKEMQREGFKISDDAMKKLIEKTQGSSGERFINDDLNDEMKNWVADHYPDYMSYIHTPTAHMVAKLFDNIKLDKSGETSYHFADAIKSWLGYHGYWMDDRVNRENKPNEHTLRLLKAEAMRRKGIALAALLAVLRNFDELKKKVANGERTVSFPHNVKVRNIRPEWMPKSGSKKKNG